MPLSPAGCPWIRLSEHQQWLHPFTPRPPSFGRYICEFENLCLLGDNGFQGCSWFLIFYWAVNANRLWYTGTQEHEGQGNQFHIHRCIDAHTCMKRKAPCLSVLHKNAFEGCICVHWLYCGCTCNCIHARFHCQPEETIPLTQAYLLQEDSAWAVPQ